MIRRLGPGDLRLFRQMRLEALRLEPEAYASSSEDWEALPEGDVDRILTDGAIFALCMAEEAVGLAGLFRAKARRMRRRATVGMVYARQPIRGTGQN